MKILFGACLGAAIGYKMGYIQGEFDGVLRKSWERLAREVNAIIR